MFPSIQRRQYGFERKSKLFDIARGVNFVQRLKLDKKLEVHAGCVNTICWSDNGEWLLSGSDDQNIAITNPFTQKKIASIRSGHRANIFSAKFLPNSRNNHVISCSGAGKIFFTEVNREDTYGKNRFDCHVGTTYEVITVPNEAATFLSCGEDGTVRWFDLRAKTSCLKENCKDDVMINCRQAVTSLAVDPTMPYHLAAACSDSSVRIFDRRMLGTRSSGNYTGRGITGMISRFTAPLEHKAYRITSLNYSNRGHDVLVSYSSENIYLFCTLDESKPRELRTRNTPEGDDRLTDGQSSSGDGSGRQPPIKRLRLRGDWSDTGPNARPERERIQEESGNQSPHATLMQRMSEMLTRWLDGSLRRDDEGPGQVDAEGAASNLAQPTASNDQEMTDGSVRQLRSTSSNPSPLVLETPPTHNQESTQSTSAMMADESSQFTSKQLPSHRTPSSSNHSLENTPLSITSQTSSHNVTSQTGATFAVPDAGISVLKSPPNLDEILASTSSINPCSSHQSSQLPSDTSDDNTQLSGLSPMEENFPSAVDNKETGNICSDSVSVSSLNVAMCSLDNTKNETSKACEPFKCVTIEDDNTVPSECSLPKPGNSSDVITSDKSLTSTSTHTEFIQEKCAFTKQTPTIQKICENTSHEPQSSLARCPTEESVDNRSDQLTESNIVPSLGSSTVESSAIPKSLSKSIQTEQTLEPYIHLNYSSEGTSAGTISVGFTSYDSMGASSSSQRSGNITNPLPPSASSNSTQPSDQQSKEIQRVDNEAMDTTEQQITSVDSMDTGINVTSQTVATTEPDNNDHNKPSTSTDQGRSNQPSSSRGGRQRRIGISGPPTGNFQLGEEEESSDDDIIPRPIPRCRFFRDESDEERHIAAFKLQTAYRKRQEVREQHEMKDVYQPKTKRKFKGHRNARTMIKEANFWGDDFVMSGSDCGHIFIWDRHTGEVIMLLEADRHVVNCLQPHPYDPILASSGIDYDIKLWAPLEDTAIFDVEKAQEVIRRNEIMLEETRDTITVPAAFMLRVLASLNQIRAGRNVTNQPENNVESTSDSE